MKGMDPRQLMAQARKMKDDMDRVQSELKERMVEGKSGDGLVRITFDGNQQPQAVVVAPAAHDPSDPTMLEDLLLLAIKDGLAKSRKMSEEAMAKITGGAGGLGGMF
jgi:DNA-binding YbaB/EbfC family protein